MTDIGRERCSDEEVALLPVKEKEKILNILYEFDNIFTPPISEIIIDMKGYAEKLFLHSYVYTAAKAQRNLGFTVIYANDNDDHVAYIPFIGVHPEDRGKKIGQMLLEKCFDISKENNMKYIKLEVRKNNINALHFYKKNSFTEAEEASSGSIYMIKKI